MSRRRRWVVGAVAVVVTLAVWSLAAPRDLGSGELIVLRRFLPASGLEIRDADAPPAGGGAFLLLVDHRTSDEEETLLSWVNSGGRLVVADPGSQLFERFAVAPDRAGVFGATALSPGCVRPETVGVGAIEVAATDQLLSTGGVSGACFSSGGGSFALFVPRGRGEIVLLGGASVLTDPYLDRLDNAVFARTLLDAGGPVVFGPAAPPTAEVRSLWSVVPTRAKAVVWEFAVAALLFALARGQRLGRPVPEDPVSPIPSGELVTATARLYRRGRAVAFCAGLVRTWTAERLARRLGIPPDPDRRRLAATISNATGVEREPIERALAGPEPANDEELVALCRELETMARRIEGARR
jgi:hypothetical protein